MTKLPSGSWRFQIRRNGQYASKSFKTKSDGERWARQAERATDTGELIAERDERGALYFREAIRLHIADMCEVGKAPRRSKTYCLETLTTRLGHFKINELKKAVLIDFARMRAKQGAGPVTIGMELGYIRTVLDHVAAIHGYSVTTEPVSQARVALKRLGLIGKSAERDRRPSEQELNRLFSYFSRNPRHKIPIERIIKFAVATGLRQEEICRITWNDINYSDRTLIVRDRKHPREKTGNHQTVALVVDAGWDPFELLNAQSQTRDRVGRVFPYCSNSIGAAFRRGCKALGIKNLRFHDLRHETASRLFEAGYDIPEVALVTGHKDWKMLKRYTNLRPRDLAAKKYVKEQAEGAASSFGT